MFGSRRQFFILVLIVLAFLGGIVAAEIEGWHKIRNAQLDRGQGITYNAEIITDITQSAIDAMHSGQPINPDVLL